MKKAQSRHYFKCPFPNCFRTFEKEEGKEDLCNHHRQFVSDLLFVLSRLKPPEEAVGPQDGPKIYVPKPGMTDQAIKEARQAAGRGP